PKAHLAALCAAEPTGKPLSTFPSYPAHPARAFTPFHAGGPTATPARLSAEGFAPRCDQPVEGLDPAAGHRLGQNRAVLGARDGAARVVDGDLLILFVGGKPGAGVVALDKGTGKRAWQALGEAVTNSSPVVVAAGGKRQLVVWAQESVTSLDPATGKTYWRERL